MWRSSETYVDQLGDCMKLQASSRSRVYLEAWKLSLILKSGETVPTVPATRRISSPLQSTPEIRFEMRKWRLLASLGSCLVRIPNTSHSDLLHSFTVLWISAKSRVQHSSALNLSKAFLLATICSVAPLRGLPKWVLQQVPRAVKVLA